jgi:hypothetical protein
MLQKITEKQAESLEAVARCRARADAARMLHAKRRDPVQAWRGPFIVPRDDVRRIHADLGAFDQHRSDRVVPIPVPQNPDGNI